MQKIYNLKIHTVYVILARDGVKSNRALLKVQDEDQYFGTLASSGNIYKAAPLRRSLLYKV